MDETLKSSNLEPPVSDHNTHVQREIEWTRELLAADMASADMDSIGHLSMNDLVDVHPGQQVMIIIPFQSTISQSFARQPLRVNNADIWLSTDLLSPWIKI